MVCHANNRVVYDMVWIADNMICTLAGSMNDGSKCLDCYSVKDNEISYFPSYITLNAKACYTRLIYCVCVAVVSPVVAGSIIVVSPGTLTFFRPGEQQAATTLTYSPPGTSLLTAFCVISQGLVFATDRGEVQLVSPELPSLVMLAQHRIGEAGFYALCSDGNSLFLFNETGFK